MSCFEPGSAKEIINGHGSTCWCEQCQTIYHGVEPPITEPERFGSGFTCSLDYRALDFKEYQQPWE